MPLSKNAKIGLGVAGAVAAAAVGYLVYKTVTGSSDAPATTDSDAPATATTADPVDVPKEESKAGVEATPVAAAGTELDEATTLTIMTEIHSHTQQLLMSIAQLQQAAEERNEDVSQKQLLSIYYERSEKIRQMVLAKNGGVTEEDLSKALERHSGNRKIKQLTDMLAQLTDAISSANPGSLPDVPDTITADVFLAKLDLFVAAVEQNLQDAIDGAKAENLTGQELADEITNRVMMNAKTAQDKAFADMEMTDLLFQACLKKYQTDERVQQKFAKLNENNSRRLMEVTNAASK